MRNKYKKQLSQELTTSPMLLFTTVMLPTPTSIFTFTNDIIPNPEQRRYAWPAILQLMRIVNQLFCGNILMAFMAIYYVFNIKDQKDIVDLQFPEGIEIIFLTSFGSTMLAMLITEYTYYLCEYNRTKTALEQLGEIE